MLNNLNDNKKPLFIPFIMAGCPNEKTTLEALHTLSEVGADIIELGVPFSDPIADGKTNQRAAEITIKNSINLEKCLNIVRKFRIQKHHTPIVLFSYFNPILTMGVENFCILAKESGVNGVLIVDLPPEECEEFYFNLKQNQLDIILLVSPTTQQNRISLIRKFNPAFIYYISRLGVTGVQNNLSSELNIEIKQLKNLIPEKKIVVGFGISTIEQARSVAQYADGVVVGSFLVEALINNTIEEFKNLTKKLSDSIHSSRDFYENGFK